MQRRTQTEQELLRTLHGNIRGTVVITSNDRAARSLRQRYNRWQQENGNAGWVTPQILAWEPWLGTLWEAATLSGIETRVLLHEVQELELWRKVLLRDDAAKHSQSITALAELARSAWQQMHRYKIPLQRLRNDSSLDTQAFYRWATEFENGCRRSGLLPASQLETAVLQWLPSNEIPLPQEVFLLGFDRATPSQAFLVDALHTAGCAAHFVELHPDDRTASAPAIVYARTQEEEITAAAHWIRQTLFANPAQRIGVIVPALGEMRDAIDATFRQILAPSSIDIRAMHAMLPYEFSLGTPMQRVPAIRTALNLLRWLHESISSEEISWLLVHGSFSAGSKNDHAARDRARLDRRFRDRDFQLGGPVSFAAFRRWLSHPANGRESGALHRTVEHLSAAVENHALERLRSFAEWREVIEELLTTANWQLQTAAGSWDYQLLQRWNTLLNDLSSLNSVSGPVKFAVVLEKLQHLAAHMMFALESRNMPVQVVGISESAGLVFDSTWWMNARIGAWPPHGKAQPFLPWHLQREARMPYADPAEDYAFALHATKRIFDSGKNIVVSFALQEADATNASAHIPNREVLLSPLVREVMPAIPMVSAEDFLPLLHPAQTSPDIAVLETLYEESAVPFHSKQVKNGVRFLELQAACPFRALAEMRLGSLPLADLGTGLSPREQGTVMHRALHRFWQEMKSQKQLLATSTEQYRHTLRKHIGDALAEFFQHATEPWQTNLLEIELDRIEDRLLAWLEQEKKRPDFVVIGTEDALPHSELAGIELRCRVDRIDAVEQGIALIDYKTGPVNRNSCDGDRPDQPQLPAYAVLRSQSAVDNEALAGVAFAGLHPRKTEFTVVSSLPAVFEVSSASAIRTKSKANPTALSPEEMQRQQESWNTILTRLAEDFRAGVAIVDPKKPIETCRHCKQGLLCRIRETKSAAAENAEDKDSESFAGALDSE